MESRYDPTAARQLQSQYPGFDEELVERVYTAHLVGEEPSLALHSTGAASVKSRVGDLFGEETEVIYVKGEGCDLATIEPLEFPACRLIPLRRSCELPELSDAKLLRQLYDQWLDPTSGPPPTVSGVLHSIIPGRFVDQVPSDAVLQVVDQPDSSGLVRQIFGDGTLHVPYAREGAPLALTVSELWQRYLSDHGREPELLILDKQGIVTWGETARQSYEKLIAAVTRAELAVANKYEVINTGEIGQEHDEQRRSAALAVRGAMQRASGRHWIGTWRSSAKVLRFTRRHDLKDLAQLGCVSPEHVSITKARPLVLDSLIGGVAESLRTLLDHAVHNYRDRYLEYLDRCAVQRGVSPSMVDPWPRVVVVVGVGVLCLGKTLNEANVVADIFEHTVEVIEGASALGSFRTVGELELFDREFWSLEHRRRQLVREPLSGRIALVTGAASGIGLATSRALLAAGAHVLITDDDERVLEAVSERPQLEYPGRLSTVACDVTSDRSCKDAMQQACDTYGGIDILVSNAGIAPSGGLHTESGDAALRMSLDVNLLGQQRIARATVEAMIAQGSGGVLLFNASKSAFHQGPDFGPYAVPKAALIALMRQYAIDMGRYGIRSNAVNADRIRTKQYTYGVEEQPRMSPSEYFRSNLLGRETTPEQVAEAFVYLATAEATTGCVITVDGGNPAAFPR